MAKSYRRRVVNRRTGEMYSVKTPSGRFAHSKSAFRKAKTGATKGSRKANFTVGCVEFAKAKIGIAEMHMKNRNIKAAKKNLRQATKKLNKAAYGKTRGRSTAYSVSWTSPTNYSNYY